MPDYVYALFVDGYTEMGEPDMLVVQPFEGIIAAQSEFKAMGFTDVECDLNNIILLQVV